MAMNDIRAWYYRTNHLRGMNLNSLKYFGLHFKKISKTGNHRFGRKPACPEHFILAKMVLSTKYFSLPFE